MSSKNHPGRTEVVKTVCRIDDGSNCRIQAIVKDGVVTRVEPIDFPHPDMRHICLRGLITVMDGDRNIRHFEFFETEDSWRRPHVMHDFNIGARHGYRVYVVVPDGVYQEFLDRVGNSPDARFTTSTYSRCMIPPRILA